MMMAVCVPPKVLLVHQLDALSSPDLSHHGNPILGYCDRSYCELVQAVLCVRWSVGTAMTLVLSTLLI